jgi:DNA-binding FrmR family transcriptional regulator
MNLPVVGGERGAAVRHAQRATGQTAALAAMIASGRPFTEVAQQVLAARGSLDSLLVRLVELELRDCLPGRKVRDEVDGLLRAALGRSAPGRRPIPSRQGRSSITPPPTHDLAERTSR